MALLILLSAAGDVAARPVHLVDHCLERCLFELPMDLQDKEEWLVILRPFDTTSAPPGSLRSQRESQVTTVPGSTPLQRNPEQAERPLTAVYWRPYGNGVSSTSITATQQINF